MTAQIIDGKAIAKKFRDSLRSQVPVEFTPRLTIFVVGENPVIETYVAAKLRAAEKVGMLAHVERRPESIDEEKLIYDIKSSAAVCDGIIVQLPLPQHLDRDRVLNTIPATHDVDVLTDAAYKMFEDGLLPSTPPVASACLKALSAINFTIQNSKIAVVGYGKLVGMPCDVLFTRLGASVSVVRKNTPLDERLQILKGAQVIITGIGVPNSLTADDIAEGCILLDAGTSEREGGTTGDIHINCSEKAAFISPVPGGIGPLTVASLYENLLLLAVQKHKKD